MRIYALIVLLTFFSGNLFANSHTFYGSIELEDGESDSLIVYGRSSIENYEFNTGDFYGALFLRKTKAEAVNFFGSGNILETSINKLRFNGAANIKNSAVGDIQAATLHLILDNSEILGDIIIDDTQKEIRQLAALDIKENSFIKGKVIFKSGQGVINVYGNTQAPEKIDGGKVIFMK